MLHSFNKRLIDPETIKKEEIYIMALSSRRETDCTFPWRDISFTLRGISNFERCDETNGRTPLYVATSLKTG